MARSNMTAYRNELQLGETLTQEFKSDIARLNDRELVAAVVALANTEGGLLWLGVEDDGQVTGLHRQHLDLSGMAAMIANRTTPPISVAITGVHFNSKLVARIEVPRMQLVSSSDGLMVHRRLKADGSKVFSVSGNLNLEPLIHRTFVTRPNCHSHVQETPIDSLQGGFSRDHYILIGNFGSAVSFQLPHRVLAKPSVSQAEFSGNGHLTHKALVGHVAAAGFPVLHPADHHPASVLRQQGLGCIKVKAVVNCLHILPHQVIDLPVEGANQAYIGVAGMEFQADGRHFLGAGQQDVFPVQGKEVRTFFRKNSPL